MIRPRAVALAALASLAACASPPVASTSATVLSPGAGTDDAAIDAAEQAFVDLIVATRPQDATVLGLHARDADLDEASLAGAEANVKKAEAMRDGLKQRFATPLASLAKKVDLELIERTLDVDAREAREKRPLEREPQHYLEPLDALFVMVARDYAPADARAKNLGARLEKIPAVLAAAKTNLKNPPRIWTQVALESAKQAPAFFDQVRPFLDASLKGPDHDRATTALAGARAAYADYATFLEKDLLPRSNGDFAAGRAYFDFRLHTDYALTEDADAVARIGQKVFDETDAAMTALAKKMDPMAAGWPEIVSKMKSNHPTAADLVPSYKREVARARAFLVAKDAVPFPAQEECDVLETPPFLRNTTTASYDQAPPFDAGSKRGFFFVTPVDGSLSADEKEGLLRDNNHAEQVDTVVHETYPGHHLQLSFSRTYPSIARKVAASNIFAEGWGLYAEELMDELGYYTDEERMAYLEWVLVRAARVGIDVGLHTRGMTFDQAVAVLTDKVHLEKVLAVNEVKRYTATPTQPLSYMMGRQKILALRERMKQKDGAAFSLKHFHEVVLSHGTIPPGYLEEEIFGGT